ncbi:hypothetical protein PRUPE_3G001600 [Prunus persica]|uniref:Meiosis-specific protein ASY3-like coiled-coil domain-containing protein n=1 Tax=Prunus persica TaxID=3760 RepID=A0A251PUA5_PRUPE|nr:hypothetical protein PRUPE_3G001600 [Prunus persica]
MSVDTRRYLRDDQTSNCRSFGSINHPSSQSRKISIGIMVDQLAKKKSGVTKEGEVVVPNAEMEKSNLGNITQGKNKKEEFTASKKAKQTKDPQQVNSPWITTTSFHQKMRTSDTVLHAKQYSNLPSGSGKQYKLDGARNAPLTYSVQFFANQTSFLESDGKKQNNFDRVNYQKKEVKDRAVEVQDFTFETAKEVIMSDKEVLVDKAVATEGRRTETLRMKLWEILGTVSSPDDQRSKSQLHKVGDDKLNPQQEFDQMGATVVKSKQNSDRPGQKYDEKGDASINPRQNSDTIEMDSESPDNIVRRPVTRSLSRKRAPTKKQHRTATNGPSPGYKMKHREDSIFSFEECCEKLHGSFAGGSSKSTRKKRENKSFRTEFPGICLPEKDKSTKIQQPINRSETPSPAKQATSVDKTMGNFHGCLPENEREYLELEKNIQEQEIYQSPLTTKKFKRDFDTLENKDQHEEDNGNPSLKNDANPEDDYLSPTFGIKTPVSSSSPSSIPKSDHDTVEEELKDSPLRKTAADVEENDAEDGLFLSSSEERDLGSCEEGSPIIHGHDWTGEDNWIEEPSEPNQVDGLARAVELFALELEKLKTKLRSATNRKSSEILMSVAGEVHMQLQNVESQIQTDVGKLTNLSKSKRKRLESRFEEQQEHLKVIYDKFKEQVNQHLQDCRSTFEGLDVYQTEFKGTVEKQKASHRKLLLQVEEAIETQLNDAQGRIQVMQEMGRGKMLQLKHELALCLKEGILS